MAAVCGICAEQPSKYRCPKCDLRYCSLVCYKPHKAEHESAGDTLLSTASVATSPPVEGGNAAKETERIKRLFGKKKIDFATFEQDQELAQLFKKFPDLRVQLQSAYGYTLEPPSRENRGSGGRGGRGGRGRGDFGGRLRPGGGSGGWTQAKGDKDSQEHLKRMRDVDPDGGVAEFVRLVRMRFGDAAAEAG